MDISVKNIMKSDIVSVQARTPVREILNLMLNNAVSSVFVVDGENMLTGVINRHNLILSELTVPHRSIKDMEFNDFIKLQKNIFWGSANDIITPNFTSIEDSDNIISVLDLMENKKFSRLPVVREGKLVGVIELMDIVKYLYELCEKNHLAGRPLTDREIYQMIEKALKKSRDLNKLNIRFYVWDGAVHLLGQVSSLNDAEKVARIIEEIPGVKEINNRLLVK